ncbi:SDR family oxidoreductase [Sphingomonas sp. BK069]|uniref:SDR family oxidoreductase n=1 Tax=Sphingomonas sp. BK069 TaxID=2586979 RepID=UPI00161DB7B9|nr:SDR family oxidoreductase [Sphingomonas sp. BK069]MBB3347238.1 short-subunit dehydrogenase [Sphingomonas sp. BK069]
MARTIVVTGGSAGIGLAIAERFARDGWQVAIVARQEARLQQASAMLAAAGAPKVLAISADVADVTAIDAAAARVEAELGAIAAWVNNAMSTVVAPADRITAAEYERVTATTYLSQVYGTLAALRYMKPRGKGAIVQISSGLAERPAPLQAAYCAAKAAVTGFTDSLRAELIADKSAISLSVIYLPAVNTPQPTWARNRSGREQVLPDPLFDPRLCAEAALEAVRRPQREFWVGRSTAMMALVQSLAPAFADRQAAKQIDAMSGAPAPDREGNLDRPYEGPAAIDGPSTDRAQAGQLQTFSSRQRDLLKLGAAGGLLGIGAAAAFGLARIPPRLRS